MRARVAGSWFVLSTFAAIAALGQEHPNVAKGLAGGGGVGLDAVSPFNGNLSIRLPIGQTYPVNAGLSYQLALVYNSQVWEHEAYDEQTVAIPARGNNAGLGWTLHLGRLNPPSLEFNTLPSPDFNRNTYLAPDGSFHTFYPTLHEGEAAIPGVEYTRDGSYLRLKTASRQIEHGDGTVHTFSSLTNGYLTRIQDPFGNFVQVDYLDCTPTCSAVSPANAHRWQITDTQGRVHRIDFRDTGQPYQARVITQVDLQTFGGARALYKLLYNDSTDDQSTTGSPVGLTGCNGSPGSGSNHLVWLLTRLELPDGSVFDLPKAAYFAFNVPGDLNNPCKTGLINRLRLPTLGQIEWDYILYKFPSASTTRNVWQRTTGVGVRRLLDASSSAIGQWTYAPVLSGGTTAHEKLLTSTVTDPLGNRVARYFSVCVDNCSHADGPYEYGLAVGRDVGSDGSGRFASAQFLDTAGAPLRTTYVGFEHDAPTTGTTIQEKSRLNQRLSTQRTLFNDDPGGGFADEAWSNFDGLGHYRYLTRGGNLFASGYALYTHFNAAQGTYGQPGYVPPSAGSPWLIGRHAYEWSSDGVQLLFRWVCTDSQTGFLSGRRTVAAGGGSLSTIDLVETFTQSAGNVVSEKYFGGDTQAVTADPTQGAICAMASQPRGPGGAILSPTYQYSHTYSGGSRSRTTVSVGGTTLNLLDLTIDGSTGLASASRDPAGKQTTFAYDVLGRPTTVDPADDLLTVTSYCTATSVPSCANGVQAQTLVGRRATPGGTDVTATRSRFDYWGRLVSEEQRLPPAGSFSARTMTYNALGWKTFASELGSGFGTTFLNHDAFGRPRTIRPPDGGAHDITLSYQGDRQVSRTVKLATSTTGETNATTTEVYDRYGRLYEVMEPNGVRTRYLYDSANHLKKVCQGATGSGTGTCAQQRLFNYDLRGLLISEQHPEKGPVGNGSVSYSSYDARGHALRIVDGPNDLTFTYDKAERLTEVREAGGAQRVLKTFGYAAANLSDASGTDWRKGKLISASRFNYIGPPFNATAEVRDTFAFRATEGRISEQSRQLIFNGLDQEKFLTTYSYDGLGLISSLGQPDCVFGDCLALDTPRIVGFNYTNGRLTGVPGYTGTAGGVNQITYHSNGLLYQVPHANGVLFTQQNDPSGMLRPGALTAVRGAATLWSDGAYAWDGAGSPKAIGSQTFVYDALSRVLQGNLPGGTQSYTYDNFGNIQSVATGGSVVSTPTSSTTNRLTAGGYDAAGNLTSWSGNSYEYDAFNQVVHYRSGLEDWFYIYGPDDERFWSYRVGGGGSLWALRDLSGRVLRQYDAHLGWSSYQDYIYRDGFLLAVYLSNGQQRHVDVDHLGTVRLITDVGGLVVGSHRYYPFGQEQTVLQEGERLKFTGHERDLANLFGDGDDLDYMHARHYSPITGRFLSLDPLGGSRHEPQSLNRYGYVMENPMTYADPWGLSGFATVVHSPPPAGMSLLDSYYYGTAISVGSGGVGSLFTGTGTNLWLGGLSFSVHLGLATNNPDPRAGGFDLQRAFGLSMQGYMAFQDGAWPFVDPWKLLGFYNPNEVGMAEAKTVGALTRDAEILAASSGSTEIFGVGKWMNTGRYLRIGHSEQLLRGQPNRLYFSLRGEWITRISRFFGATHRAPHWNLWIVRYF